MLLRIEKYIGKHVRWNQYMTFWGLALVSPYPNICIYHVALKLAEFNFKIHPKKNTSNTKIFIIYIDRHRGLYHSSPLLAHPPAAAPWLPCSWSAQFSVLGTWCFDAYGPHIRGSPVFWWIGKGFFNWREHGGSMIGAPFFKSTCLGRAVLDMKKEKIRMRKMAASRPFLICCFFFSWIPPWPPLHVPSMFPHVPS